MRCLVALVALIVALSPVMALADTSDNVNIVAVPYTGGGLLGFTATYIHETRVDLAWTFVPGTTIVMIRSKYNSEPLDATDGNLVYLGNAVSFSDTSMDFDETAAILYYKAFGQIAPGVYGAPYDANVEGIAVLMGILLGGGLIALIAGFVAKKPLIGAVSAGFWLLGGFYSFTKSTQNWTSWDIYLGIAFFGLFMAIVTMVAAGSRAMSEKPKALEQVIAPTEAEQFTNEYSEMQKAWSIFKSPPPKEGKGDW